MYARHICDKVFAGNRNVMKHILKQTSDGTSPNGVVTATRGAWLIIDYVGNATDGDVYINTSSGLTGTTWTMVYDAA